MSTNPSQANNVLRSTPKCPRKLQRPLSIADENKSRVYNSFNSLLHVFGPKATPVELNCSALVGYRTLFLAEASGKTIREAEAALTMLELSKNPVYLNPRKAQVPPDRTGEQITSRRPEPRSGPGTTLTSQLQWQAVAALEASKQPKFPTRRPRGPFRLLGCMMSNPEILYSFIARLTINDLISLYAISKPFHFLFNRHYMTFVMANARYWAGSQAITNLPWTAYPAMTLYDPIKRDLDAENEQTSRWSAGHWKKKYAKEDALAASIEQNATDLRIEGLIEDKREGVAATSSATVPKGSRQPLPLSRCRVFPNLRYLRMLHTKSMRAFGICGQLVASGHFLNLSAARSVMVKLSFLADIPTNANRIGLIHNTGYFTDVELIHAAAIFIKLDMRLSDGGPFHPYPDNSYGALRWKGAGRILRQTLLGQRSLGTLFTSLFHLESGPTTQLDFWRMLVSYSLVQRRPRRQNILDIPWWRIGHGNKEGRDLRRDQLLRIDELVWREIYRRSLGPCAQFLLVATAGYLLPRRIEPYMRARKKIVVPTADGQGELVAYVSRFPMPQRTIARHGVVIGQHNGSKQFVPISVPI